MSAGVLSAERDGPHIKFTMVYPDGFDHAFVVELLDPVTGAWGEVHAGSAKFLVGDVGYEYPQQLPDGSMDVLGGPRTYRALPYRRVEQPGTPVRWLETDGAYTDPVTID